MAAFRRRRGGPIVPDVRGLPASVVKPGGRAQQLPASLLDGSPIAAAATAASCTANASTARTRTPSSGKGMEEIQLSSHIYG